MNICLLLHVYLQLSKRLTTHFAILFAADFWPDLSLLLSYLQEYKQWNITQLLLLSFSCLSSFTIWCTGKLQEYKQKKDSPICLLSIRTYRDMRPSTTSSSACALVNDIGFHGFLQFLVPQRFLVSPVLGPWCSRSILTLVIFLHTIMYSLSNHQMMASK